MSLPSVSAFNGLSSTPGFTATRRLHYPPERINHDVNPLTYRPNKQQEQQQQQQQQQQQCRAHPVSIAKSPPQIKAIIVQIE